MKIPMAQAIQQIYKALHRSRLLDSPDIIALQQEDGVEAVFVEEGTGGVGGEGSAISPPYSSGFTIKDVSETDESTGVKTCKILLCYGSTYVKANPDATPPVVESYDDYAGAMYINGNGTFIEAQKFDITASKYLVMYSEISETTAPYINDVQVKLIDNISTDMPSNAVFIVVGFVKYTAPSGTAGEDDYVKASMRIYQSYEQGYSIYMPAFATTLST